MNNEIHETQVGLAADHDIRRVPDQGGRPAHVGSYNLSNQKRNWVNFKFGSNGKSYRDYQQDRCHVVQEGRPDGCNCAQGQHQLPGVAFGPFGRLYRQVFENTCILGNANNNHHPGE